MRVNMNNILEDIGKQISNLSTGSTENVESTRIWLKLFHVARLKNVF